MVSVMQGNERTAYLAIAAVICVLTMMWMAGPVVVAELRGVKTRLAATTMPRVNLRRPAAYLRRYGYRGEHRKW